MRTSCFRVRLVWLVSSDVPDCFRFAPFCSVSNGPYKFDKYGGPSPDRAGKLLLGR